jgi:hypothetical protein
MGCKCPLQLENPVASPIIKPYIFQNERQNHYKKGRYFKIIYEHQNDYKNSWFISFQILFVLEFSHFYILIKLFYTILLHPLLEFKKPTIFSSQFKHQFHYYQWKPRNRNNNISYKIFVVFIPWMVFLKLKIKCDK